MSTEAQRQLVGGFDHYFNAIPPRWWPGKAHEEAMKQRWGVDRASTIVDDPTFQDKMFLSLKSWGAFRAAGVRHDILLQNLRTALSSIGLTSPRLKTSTSSISTL